MKRMHVHVAVADLEQSIGGFEFSGGVAAKLSAVADCDKIGASATANAHAAIFDGLFSGSPLGITQATNTTFAQGGGQRPNWTGVSAKLSNPTVEKWFDTSQFTIAAPYTFGNVGRTLSGLRSSGLRQLAFTLNKTTTFSTR